MSTRDRIHRVRRLASIAGRNAGAAACPPDRAVRGCVEEREEEQELGNIGMSDAETLAWGESWWRAYQRGLARVTAGVHLYAPAARRRLDQEAA